MKQPSRLMNKNFFLLWQGQFVSRLGSQAYMIAMMFWLKHATGSATLMGTLMMLSMLPMVLLGPFGGTFADLHSRKKIIVVSDLVFGVSVLSLAAVMFTMPEATGLIVVWLTVVSVVSGVVRNIVDFGAFVDIGLKNDGLIHISEMSEQRIQHPLEILSVNQYLPAIRVLAADPQRGRVSLSLKEVKQ